MFLEHRDLPSNVSNTLIPELWQGLIHIKAIRLTKQEAVGQAVLGSFGVLSCLVVLALLFYLLSHVFYMGRGARKERAQSLKRFLASDMGVYLLCLLVSDLGMSLAAICDLYWARQFVIRHSTLCNFQGVANQFGVCAAAFWNLALAVQTFLLLFIRYTPPSWAKWIVVPTGWVFAILMTVIGPAMNKSPYSFYGPESSGCWLTIGSSNYKAWLLAASYVSISALAIMVVLYVIIFLSLSGALEKITNRQNSSTGRGSSSGGGKSSGNAIPSSVQRGRQVRKVARKMLYFPLSYGVGSLALVVCTLLAANGQLLDHTVYIVSDLLFCMISVADVAIFVITRHHLLASTATPSTHGGISMHVVTTSFNPPAQGGKIVGDRALPYVRPRSPVDSLESEVESYKEEVEKSRHVEAWETPKQARRASTQQKSARSQGHEDSLGLVKTPGAAQSDDFLTKIDSIDESRSSKVTLAKF